MEINARQRTYIRDTVTKVGETVCVYGWVQARRDMGKVIFSIYFKDEYKKVRQFAMENKKPLYFAENALFEIDHALLSALLMKRWNFPQSILFPCRFHHVWRSNFCKKQRKPSSDKPL